MSTNQNPIVVPHLRHEITISLCENGARCIEIKNETGEIINIFEAHLSHDAALGYGCGYVDGHVEYMRAKRIKEGLCVE